MSRLVAGATAAVGIASIFVVMLAPALLGGTGANVLPAAALPLCFFAAGGAAVRLRPRQLVGRLLLLVGVLHLGAIASAVLAGTLEATWPSFLVSATSVLAFALGFVTLMDLFLRFPDDRYPWSWAHRAVLVVGGGVLLVVTLSVLGSPQTPSVLGLDGPANPVHLPALAPLAGVVGLVVMPPLLGLVGLSARYVQAPVHERAQLRWPLASALLLAGGLVASGLVETVLGPTVQTAIFITVSALLPVSFLVGLLQHGEEAERLRALEASRARLAEVAVQERRRIERDLHDGAQQELVALMARIEVARTRVDDPDTDRELASLGHDVRRAHQGLRELAHGIHSATLEDHGLAAAVRVAAGRMPVSVPVSVQVDSRALDRYAPGVEEAAYFLVLEALTNTLKHAAGSTPRVRLEQTGEDLVVTVEDDGPGGVVEAQGSGLTGLRDRLAAVGGRVEIESTPRGTCVRGILPGAGRGHS